MMKSTKKLGECEDYEACDSTLQTGHVFGPNGVQQHFYRKGSKMTLCLIVMALSEYFTVTTSKCRFDGNHHKSS